MVDFHKKVEQLRSDKAILLDIVNEPDLVNKNDKITALDGETAKRLLKMVIRSNDHLTV